MAKERNEYSSIFDAASKMSDKKGKIAADRAAGKAVGVEPLTDEELDARFKRCKELHALIQDNLDKAFEEQHLTKKEVHEYFDSPENFTEKQWQLIQAQKDATREKLAELVPKKKKSLAEKKAAAKGQKPKSMQTKSRWLPM